MFRNISKENQIYAWLLFVAGILLAICVVLAVILLFLPSGDAGDGEEPTERATEAETQVDPSEVILSESSDAGTEYIDRMIFFGESTTAHLRSRGVLTGGTETKQVWADSSGTKTLSSKTPYETVIYPETGESKTLSDALSLAKPEYLVLSFGLNGLAGFTASPDSYLNAYQTLIDTVKKASPDTKIILQTVYPITGDCPHWEDPAATNVQIAALNLLLPDLAAKNENVRVADTASVLCNDVGALKNEYDNGDGYHLTASAYNAVLNYLRTHAWK